MTFEDRQRVAMLDQARSAWRQPTPDECREMTTRIAAHFGVKPTWAQEQAVANAYATQRALIDHAKQGQLTQDDDRLLALALRNSTELQHECGQLAPPDEGPDPLGR